MIQSPISRQLPPPARFILPAALFHRDGQPCMLLRVYCTFQKLNKEARATPLRSLSLFKHYDPDEFRISSIIKKMYCHSGESQNLLPLNNDIARALARGWYDRRDIGLAYLTQENYSIKNSLAILYQTHVKTFSASWHAFYQR